MVTGFMELHGSMNVSNTQGDSDVISFHLHVYASWFSPPFCG